MTAVLWLALAATPNPFLAEGLALEQALDFEGCVTRLQQASTQWQSTPDELRDIELHAGLCQFNLGHTDKATKHFRMALRLDDAARLPTYTTPRAVTLFEQVRRGLPQKPFVDDDLPRDAPVNTAAALTPRETPTPVATWLGRRALPLTLSGVTLASIITGVVLALQAQAVAVQANRAHFESDFYKLGTDAQGLATGATISWVIAAIGATASAVTFVIAADEERP